MTAKIDINNGWGLKRPLAEGAAVLSAMLLVLVGVSLIGGSEASIEELEVIPGFDQSFEVEGTVSAGGDASISAEILGDNPHGFVVDMEGNLQTAQNGVYKHRFTVHYDQPESVKDGETVSVKMTVTDSVGQRCETELTFRAAIPRISVAEGNVKASIEEGGSVEVDTNIEHLMQVLDGTGFGVKYSIESEDLIRNVQVSNGILEIPADIGIGKKTWVLKATVECVGGGTTTVSKVYSSEPFSIEVGYKPVFTLEDTYEAVAGDDLSIVLKLDGHTMPGEWVIERTGWTNKLNDSGSGATLVLENVSSDRDVAKYDVRFKSDSGMESDVCSFHVKVYNKADGGVVSIDGQYGPELQYGQDSRETNIRFHECEGYRLQVLDADGVDVTEKFIIDGEGNLSLSGGITDGKYTMRFFSKTTDKLQEYVVNLKAQFPPTITDVRPVAGFTIS